MNLPARERSSNPIVTRAMDHAGEIATLPEVMARIIEVTENPENGANALFELIRRDPVLSSRLLRVVNSAFYGLPGQVAEVDRAITLLGMVQVRNVALATSVTNVFRSDRGLRPGVMRDLWRHSVAVSVAARELARMAGDRHGAAEMFLTGLIHDIGLLLESQVFPAQLAEVLERSDLSQPGEFRAIEAQVIGATHEEFGEALVTGWRLPSRVCAAIGHHHDPERAPEAVRRHAMILYCADTLAGQEGIGLDLGARHQALEEEHLATIGLAPAGIEELRGRLRDEVDAMEAVFDRAA